MIRKALLFVRCASAALTLACAGAAQAQVPLSEGTVIEAVERLKPGEFFWAPEIAPEGPLLLIVNLATQRAILYRNGVPVAISTVSTGREGYRTPTGIFTVLQKHATHFSTIYDNAPMPYMQRLTWQGVALHGGDLPGYPASHGCIRLPQAFAKLLFGVTRLGMTVIVADSPTVPRVAPAADLLGSGPGSPGDVVEWHPERAPAGPVSIVVSGADRRVVVLRNGQEIGSAPVTIRGKVEGTTAYMLRLSGSAGHQWFSVALPGQAPSASPVADLGSRFGVDAGFRTRVAEIVAPGSTVIVTADTLRSATSPVPLIEAEPDR
jgi:hypothetical protein